jgi:hypothetical protein
MTAQESLFQELAIEPCCVANPEFLPFIKWKIGLMHGRYISAFPRDWKNKVLQEVNKLNDDQLKKSIKEVLLKPQIQSSILSTDKKYDLSIPWINAFLTVDIKDPFDVVISSVKMDRSNSYQVNELDKYVDLSDGAVGFLDFSEIKNIEQFQKIIKPFLNSNKRICLVNKWQWLLTDKKVSELFKSMMNLWIESGGIEFTVIRSSNENKGFDPVRWGKESNLIKNFLISKKFNGRFKYFAVNDLSNELHARSLLGTNCGIILDFGLEFGYKRHPWRLMSQSAFNAEYKNFVECDIRDQYPEYVQIMYP